MVRILTDSAAGILPDDTAALGLEVIPLRLSFEDGTCVRDGLDMTPAEFYERLPMEDKLPKTSQPTMEDFLTYFTAARDAGDTMVAVLLSSELSGTYQCAALAAAELEYDGIVLVDSRNVTLGQELLVRLALSLRDQGHSASEIADTLYSERERVRLLAVVNDLKYLHKGGRLPGAVAVVGGALGIKPVVTVQNGKVGLAGKARGLPGAFVALFKLIEEQGGLDRTMPYVVGYTDRQSLADPLEMYLINNLQIAQPLHSSIGPVIGTHVGPGAAGIAFFAKE